MANKAMKKLHGVDREALRRDMTRRNAEKSGGGAWTVRLPEGVEAYKPPEKGSSKLTVLPFEVGESGAGAERRKPGSIWYRASYFAHRGVGPEEIMVVCPAKTFGKPCPICEEAQNLKKQGDKDGADALRPKMRELYLVLDGDELKVFDFSQWNFGKSLDLIDDAYAKDPENEGGLFYMPEDKLQLQIVWAKSSGGSYSFVEASSIAIVPRKTEVDEDVVEQALGMDLGSYLVQRSYDAISALFYGDGSAPAEEEEEEEEPAPAPKKKSAPELEPEEEEEEEPAPKKKPTPAKKPAPVEEEEEEEPAPAPKKKVGKCPFDHEYGVDTDKSDNLDDCENCDEWEKCHDEKVARRKAKNAGK